MKPALQRIALASVITASLVGCYGADPEDALPATDAIVDDLTATQRCATRAPTAAELTSLQPSIVAAPVAPVTVRVYAHVIRRGQSRAQGNVPESAVAAQIAAIQASLFPDSDPNAILVTLAAVDYTTNARWFTMTPGSAAEAEATAALHRGGAGDLNLYIAEPGGGRLGWSTFPWDVPGIIISDDVMMVRHTTLPGGSEPSYGQGDVAIHEFGHWMGLVHTFQGGCSGNASGGGDFVSDTPAERTPAYACAAGRDTCGAISGPDPTSNFMDYTDDACMTSFTAGQRDRMRGAYAVWRAAR